MGGSACLARLSQLVGSLHEERAKLQADDDRKLSEIDGSRLTAIQGHLPNSTTSTLMVSLAGNIGIAAAKFYAYSRTGHQAMLLVPLQTTLIKHTVIEYITEQRRVHIACYSL